MAISVVAILLLIALIMAIKSPFRALLCAVFFCAWAGFDVDVGLRVTAYLIFIFPLALVYILKTFSSNRAYMVLKKGRLLNIVVVYAIIWSLVQIPFLPDMWVAGGLMRSPEIRAFTQIFMFLVTLSPIFIIAWLVNDVHQLAVITRTYLYSIVTLAIIGWFQIITWIITGHDPLPIGFMDSILGGDAGQRSGQFIFDGGIIYRMSSFGGEPKGLGSSLAVGLLIIQSGIKTNSKYIWPFLFLTMLATFSTMAILVWYVASIIQLIVFRLSPNMKYIGGRVVRNRYMALTIIIAIVIPTVFLVFQEIDAVQVLRLRTIERVFADPTNLESGGFLEEFNIAVLGLLTNSPFYTLLGTGLGNVHIYASTYLPEYALRYATDTVFVAKSYFLRWVSEIGLLSFIIFIFWWYNNFKYAKRVFIYQSKINNIRILVSLSWSILAFWIVSGYISAQFFILCGMIYSIRLLPNQYIKDQYVEETVK